jgi:hypothetical protein
MYKFPDNKKFAFTIVDDTDDAYLENIQPIYDLLKKNNIYTTKTVWVYPVRDSQYSKGDSLNRPEYADFISKLKRSGYEIGLHNIGSGEFVREEIRDGLEVYKNTLLEYPKMHINHSYNPDNIYSGIKRFSFPFNFIVGKLYSQYSNFSGEIPSSKHFWGDIHKKIIKYSRNYEIDDINTTRHSTFMPYKDSQYDEYANYWFSSTFCPNQWMFNHVVNRKSIDKLESEGGICILYTHLGYYMVDGEIDKGFKEAIEYLGSKQTGWYAPASNILDFLITHKNENNIGEYIPIFSKKILEFKSLWTRVKYRYFLKIDDYHFKKSESYDHRVNSINK